MYHKKPKTRTHYTRCNLNIQYPLALPSPVKQGAAGLYINSMDSLGSHGFGKSKPRFYSQFVT